MLILGRDRLKDPAGGYAKTFLRQLEESLGTALDRGVRIVANAGGLNPAGLADAVRELAQRLGLAVRVAHVEGDDLLPRAAELGLGAPLTANAYLGAWGIAECLTAGADVVVTGRVTDASLVVGPAAAHFGWARDDLDAPGRCGRGGARDRVRRPGHRRQLRVLHRARAGAARVPDRRDPRRRLVGDHQARGHRRRGDRRHGHRPAALRDRRGPLRRTGRHHPVRQHPAHRRRPGPRPHQRRARRGTTADAQGLPQHPRRLPQRGHLRAHRAGHRGQGRARPHADGPRAARPSRRGRWPAPTARTPTSRRRRARCCGSR